MPQLAEAPASAHLAPSEPAATKATNLPANASAKPEAKVICFSYRDACSSLPCPVIPNEPIARKSSVESPSGGGGSEM